MMRVDGSDISSRYGHLLAGRWDLRKGLRVVEFVGEVLRRGKHRELLSFILWELMYRCGIFACHGYLKIEGEPALANVGSGLVSQGSRGSSNAASGLAVVRAALSWKVVYVDDRGGLWGSLSGDTCALFKSVDGGRSVQLVHRFSGEIRCIFISNLGTVFVCVPGGIFKVDSGGECVLSLELSTEESSCLLHNGMTETPQGVLIIGEYGSVWKSNRWVSLANVYYSNDDGMSWKANDFLVRRGVNKHVHLVRYSSVLKGVVLTDGDNQKNAWVSRSVGSSGEPQHWIRFGRWCLRMGGYTSMAEVDGRVCLGTDHLGGTNFIVHKEAGRGWRRRVVPGVYRRNPIINMVERRSTAGMEIWALLHSSMFPDTRCLLMVSRDGGESWRRFIEYDGRACEIRLMSSSRKPHSSVFFSITDAAQEFGEGVTYEIKDASMGVAHAV